MKKKLAVVFIFTFLVLSCKGGQYKLENKSENNNTFETAQYINKDGIIGQLEGTNTDYYYFTADDKSQIIDFYISNSTYMPVTMTLYDSQTNVIKVISEPEITAANNTNNAADIAIDEEINPDDVNDINDLRKNDNQNNNFECSIQIMKGIYFDSGNNENKYYISISPKDDVKAEAKSINPPWVSPWSERRKSSCSASSICSVADKSAVSANALLTISVPVFISSRRKYLSYTNWA